MLPSSGGGGGDGGGEPCTASAATVFAASAAAVQGSRHPKCCGSMVQRTLAREGGSRRWWPCDDGYQRLSVKSEIRRCYRNSRIGYRQF